MVSKSMSVNNGWQAFKNQLFFDVAGYTRGFVIRAESTNVSMRQFPMSRIVNGDVTKRGKIKFYEEEKKNDHKNKGL